LEGEISNLSATNEVMENLGNYLLAETGDLVPIDSMSIHHAESPQTWHGATKITLDAVTVLIDFTHLWDEASSRNHSYLLNDFMSRRRRLITQ